MFYVRHNDHMDRLGMLQHPQFQRHGGTAGWGWLPVLGYAAVDKSKVFQAVSPLSLGESEACSGI